MATKVMAYPITILSIIPPAVIDLAGNALTSVPHTLSHILKMSTNILESIHLERFLFAGNATLTLESKASSKRFTFKVESALDNEGKPNGRFFVGLLSGPDNHSHFSYMGMIEPNGDFHPTRASKVSTNAESWKAFSWFMRHRASEKLAESCNVYHEGKCGRCGRKLTVPESILMGLGPECSSKVGF